MNLLSIGGSDPTSGAGIQSDVKTFNLLDTYGLTVITAITGQNTTQFGLVQPVSKKILKNQIELLFSDFVIEGIKISMVYNSEIIKTIYSLLKKYSIPIVIDPVIKSTTEGMLFQKSALTDFIKYLIPISTVITPNKTEVEFITKIKVNSKKSLKEAGQVFRKLGAKNVVITGLEMDKNQISDVVITEKGQHILKNKKLDRVNHGSGCNYSAAFTVSLARGKSILESAEFAKKFTFESIKEARKIGKGIAITQKKKDVQNFELSRAIEKFIGIRNISKKIPECQTNFVFAKKDSKSIKDILGISGRIVKTGDHVTRAGNLEYGGSKHVAKAVLIMEKKFPQIRSGINIKFENETIYKLEKNGFIVKNYDRIKEPRKIKNKEGASIEWGIRQSIKNLKRPPDAIFHKGDFGKEPMIIIFGENPGSVVEKMLKIL